MIHDTSELVKNKLNLERFETTDPVNSTLKPTTDDYSSGIITRFFISYVNYNKVVEVNKNEFFRVEGPLYKKRSFQWLIVGPERNVYDMNILKFVGVYEYNQKRINDNKTYLRGLEYLLTNPLQFWRGY